MAISPLALGIGLQGKYDFKSRALLEATRQKGRAKAEADADAAKEKKRAENRKMVANITPKGLLPTQGKEIENDVLDIVDFMENNIDNGPEILRRRNAILAKQSAYQQQASQFYKMQSQSNFEGDRDSYQDVITTDNPKELATRLQSRPSRNFDYDEATNMYSFGNAKYKNTQTRLDEILSKGGDSFYDLNKEQKTVGINGNVQVIRTLKPEVVDLALNDMLTGDNIISSNDDYYRQLKIDRKPIPNVYTEEGRIEFEEGRNAFLRSDIEAKVKAKGILLNVTKREPTRINVYNDQTADDETLVEASVPSKLLHRNVGNIQTYTGVPPMTDVELTLPISTKMWNSTKDKKWKKGGTFTAKYGKPSLVAIAKEDYKIPAQKYTMPDGRVLDLPELDVTEGEPLMEGYDEIMAQKGKSEAEYVVFGFYQNPSNPRDKISIVRPLTDLGISQAYSASKEQSKRIAYYNKQGKENKEKANAEIKAKYKGSAPAPAANKNPAPAANKKKDVAPAPAPTPKPKDNTGKVDANKANAIDKANKASGGKMKRFTKK
jgi:hypothetical protein